MTLKNIILHAGVLGALAIGVTGLVSTPAHATVINLSLTNVRATLDVDSSGHAGQSWLSSLPNGNVAAKIKFSDTPNLSSIGSFPASPVAFTFSLNGYGETLVMHHAFSNAMAFWTVLTQGSSGYDASISGRYPTATFSNVFFQLPLGSIKKHSGATYSGLGYLVFNIPSVPSNFDHAYGPFGLDGGSATLATVPEPAILPLFGVGLLGIIGLAMIRRRRQLHD